MIRKKQQQEDFESQRATSKLSSFWSIRQLSIFILGCLLVLSAAVVFIGLEKMPSIEHRHHFSMPIRATDPGRSVFLQLSGGSVRTNVSKKLSVLSVPKIPRAPEAPQPVTLDATKPVPPHSILNSSTPIHLVISAFRDGHRCARTLGFALNKARNPDRIFFEVMQALSPPKGDISCEGEFKRKQLKEFCRKRPDMASCEASVLQRLKVWTIPLDHGMGPAHQRGLLNQKRTFNSSDAMCITTDSHMDFLPGWDNVTSQEWLKANNEFGVLTVYPMAMAEDQDNLYANEYVDLCGYTLEDRIPRGKQGINHNRKKGARPYFTMNWAAGFSFHRCHADANVPVDVNLNWIFTGEEVNRAVRLWTHGYDLYLPQITTVYHDYGRVHKDFWEFGDVEQQNRDTYNSKKRLGSLFRVPELSGDTDETMLAEEKKQELGRFGLGTLRTLEQFVEWSRFDMGSEKWRSYLESKNMKVVDEHSATYETSFCKELKYVPVKDVKVLWASAFNKDPHHQKAIPPVTVL